MASMVESFSSTYAASILAYQGYTTQPFGHLHKITGFQQYNHLLDINGMFSSDPNYWPIDRTGLVNMPLRWSVPRPWQVPARPVTLDQAMADRVREITDLGKQINVFWSGGIDSTAIVTAFLQNCNDRSQLRIIYSPWSVYEHPAYMDFLAGFSGVELLDQSGEIYLDLDLDGVIILGHSGDEMHASMDRSFLDAHGYDCLSTNWRDFFWSKNPTQSFMDFCESFFAASGRHIHTVLDARWWFYANCKTTSLMRELSMPGLLDSDLCKFNVRDIYGFFDCDMYERYIYFNTDRIMPDRDYASWKIDLKRYCNQFDGLDDWYHNKTKFHSHQAVIYAQKRSILRDRRWIMLLDDGQLINTPNLPFLSEREWRQKYNHDLDYLFNDPDPL